MWRQRQQERFSLPGGLLLLLLLVPPALAQSSNQMSMNVPFQDSFNQLKHAACVTLFHRKGRLGCGTEDRSLHVGKLVYYKGNSNGNNGQPQQQRIPDQAANKACMKIGQQRGGHGACGGNRRKTRALKGSSSSKQDQDNEVDVAVVV